MNERELNELQRAIGELALAIGNPCVHTEGRLHQTLESQTVREATRRWRGAMLDSARLDFICSDAGRVTAIQLVRGLTPVQWRNSIDAAMKPPIAPPDIGTPFEWHELRVKGHLLWALEVGPDEIHRLAALTKLEVDCRGIGDPSLGRITVPYLWRNDQRLLIALFPPGSGR